MSVYMALVHYPVTDKNNNVVASSVTNFDIHDLSRIARTYEVEHFYIVTPLESQEWFVKRIIYHWNHGAGADYNVTRREALERRSVVKDLEEVAEDISRRGGHLPLFVVTSAKRSAHLVSHEQLREEIARSEHDYCIVFGTGWGLHPALIEEMDMALEPIEAVGDYNHLSVRSAAAITMDRLLGKR